MIGHNQPSIDNIVEENLLRGLYMAQLNTLVRCVDDPRMSRRHHQVLAQIIQRTNVKTGLAYPGRARLANDVVYYVNGEPRRYSEATIATTISELVECGYIIMTKRAPEGGGRALAHYATTSPSADELKDAITHWCDMVRGKPKREFPTCKPEADVDTRINVNAGVNVSRPKPENLVKSKATAADVDTRLNVDTRIDVNTGVGADVDTGIGQELVVRGTGSSTAGRSPAMPSRRGSRLPEDWHLPDDWQAWTLSNYAVKHADIRVEAQRFANYWQSKPGSGATKLDWRKTWANWCLTAFAKRIKPQSQQLSLAPPDVAQRNMADAFEAARRVDEEDDLCRP